MKANAEVEESLIAPCGMNCRLCWGYLRPKNRCPGCLVAVTEETQKSKHRQSCSLKNCEFLTRTNRTYCTPICPDFPCPRLKRMDKRYRSKYGMSMIDNLQSIEKWGIEKFVRTETKRWTCSECGHLICAHKANCLNCGSAWNPELTVRPVPCNTTGTAETAETS